MTKSKALEEALALLHMERQLAPTDYDRRRWGEAINWLEKLKEETEHDKV